MNIISKKYYLELDTKTFTPYIDQKFVCKRNDSILFYITVKADDEILDLTGCKISLVSARCNGSLIEHTIKDYKLENGVLIFSPKKSFLEFPSTFLNELVISNENESITTQSFKFVVSDLLEGDYVSGDEIQDDIDTLEELRRMLEEYNEVLNNIDSRIEEINSEIDIIDSRIDNINSEIDSIEEELEHITDGYATIAYVDSEAEKINNTINEEIEGLNSRFNDTINEQIETINTIIGEEISKVEESIVKSQEDINLLKETTDSNFESINNELQLIQENIITNANEIDLLKKQYTSLEGAFQELKDCSIIILEEGIYTDIEVQLKR